MNIPRNFHNRSPQSNRRGPPLEDNDEDEEVVDEEFDALNVSVIIVTTDKKNQTPTPLPPVHSDFINHKNQSITLLLCDV